MIRDYGGRADLYIENGKVVNVYTGETLDVGVAVAGENIIHVGRSRDLIGPETELVDAAGDFVMPGFFDAHAHADLYCNPFTYVYAAAARGTTGLFNDGHDLANALGPEEYLKLMERVQEGPFTVLSGVPATSPPYPGVEGEEIWTDRDIEAASSHEWVVSLSEVSPYPRILNGDESVLHRIRKARKRGLLAEGHTTGAGPDKLNRLALAGITSCHESLSSGDVMERARLGYHVMLRQGSIRRDLRMLRDAVKVLDGFDTSRLMLVTDGIFPDHLIAWGNMDWVVKSAVENGIAPIKAIQMATINPARYFGLDGFVGAIAPGRLAHILIAESMENPFPRLVLAKGRRVAEDGRALIEPPALGPLKGRGFEAERILKCEFRTVLRAGTGKVPVIEILDQTVTKRTDLEIPVEGGYYAPQGDVLGMLLAARDGSLVGRGFVKGLCRDLGGLASTIAHETHGLMVMGQREEDMRKAAARVLQRGGGIAICHGGNILAELDLPIGGICSDLDVPTLASKINHIHKVLREMGCTLEYPLWTIGFLSFTSVLGPRITYSGTYDVRTASLIFS
jgi:adenine deaminase